MSRFRSQQSYGHKIRKIDEDCYRISWTIDRHYDGERIRFPTTYRRVTDAKGAARFVKKWAAKEPE
jgi:hypothetical protein